MEFFGIDAKMIAGAAVCIVLFAYVGILEKKIVGKHHYMHFSLSRVFYMLLLVMFLILIYEPRVLSSRAFWGAASDPYVITAGALTALAMVLYYWMLTHKDLYLVTMIWPVITLLIVAWACVFAGERLSPLQWVGVILTSVGVWLVLSKKA